MLCVAFPRRRHPGRPPRRVPLHRKRVRVPAGVPRGVAAPGDPPALVRGPRRLLPFPATGRDLRQAGHRIDPRACIPCSREGQDRTAFSDHTVTVPVAAGACRNAQPGGAEPALLGLAGRKLPPKMLRATSLVTCCGAGNVAALQNALISQGRSRNLRKIPFVLRVTGGTPSRPDPLSTAAPALPRPCRRVPSPEPSSRGRSRRRCWSCRD